MQKVRRPMGRHVIPISMSRADKKRLIAGTREHDILLLAFLWIAADEHIKNYE